MNCLLVLMALLQVQPEGKPGDARVPIVGQDEKALSDFSKKLFDKDMAIATAAFDAAMRNPESFVELATFLHTHPARYAELMTHFEKQRQTRKHADFNANPNPYGEWTIYVHKRTEESQEFAVKSAQGWKEGWALGVKEVVPKLRTQGFPSTRRIAIEFLKIENGGDDFGFEWSVPPESEPNHRAIQKWESWLEQTPRTKP